MGIGYLAPLHLIFVELALAVCGFAGIIQAFELSIGAGLAFEAVATALPFVVLCWMACCRRQMSAEKWWCKMGGIWAYYFACFGMHGVTLGLWIGYGVNFRDLDPVTPTINTGAFVSKTDIHTVMLISFFIIFGIFWNEVRWMYGKRKMPPTTKMPAQSEYSSGEE